jgi:uncharacterized protein YegL
VDKKVVESVCITRLAEQYMVDNYINFTGDKVYFGSKVGSLRIIPAEYLESRWCWDEPYDPRHRPWYIAAASGKKDVILVIDRSQSMDGDKIDCARKAAKTILRSLTSEDRVAIVAFSDNARLLGDETHLVHATPEKKDKIEEAINNLTAGGTSNFYNAFEAAFGAWDNTTSDEDNLNEGNYDGCNLAVLFLSDGQISYNRTTSTLEEENEKVIVLINEKTAQIEEKWNIITTIFTFSFGEQADQNSFKTIACNTGGFWQHVNVEDCDDLITAMSSYYEIYALGLGEGGNDDFAVVSSYVLACTSRRYITHSE